VNNHRENFKTLIPPLLLFVALVSIFYSPYLMAHRPFFSTNLYQFLPWKQMATPEDLDQQVNAMLSDPLVAFYPFYQYGQASLRKSIFPLWNPYLLCGYPSVADGALKLFYPLRWPLFALNASELFVFSAVLRVVLAAFFMFLYLRYIGVIRKVAVFG
jgi:hypothetical protein